MNRRLACLMVALLPFGVAAAPARAAERVKVTASFSILGDMVHQVGGDRVEVTALVGPNGDAHVYEPTPTDAKGLAASKLLVLNGLGLEGWITRLEKASGFKGQTVIASKGIKPQQMEDDEHGHKMVTDPHAWQNLANGRIYAQNIRDGLIKADPDGKATYEANAAKFIAAIDALEPEVRREIGRIPEGHRKMITTHDAFGYFGTAYGMAFVAPEGISTDSEATAQEVAKIIRQIRAEKIPAVFVENITDKRLLEQISRETGAKIGGTLYSDALSPPDGPAGTYLDMFRSNVKTIVAALAPAS
ncbi:metal ABC transporter substrate-binding protein [Methylobacterium nodulans]|uniref:Periplasmic solute binding protein n=1 Tax=Methylobacterium nodulans (strain LMG 21967 / CNCM I-2342 / ORS 2060) TaxID=460265 RepID=B8IRL6_METNO|nr:metal ABC transporter substrate-binding protein [Methylobacterium nodulans]ACL60566.1 periplasmic solute binding protein [Methylobacterium nodulans ORS 2060]